MKKDHAFYTHVTCGILNGMGTQLRTLSSPLSKCARCHCHQQGHAVSKTLLQQYVPVLTWGCRLMQAVLHNSCKTVVVVVVYVWH